MSTVGLAASGSQRFAAETVGVPSVAPKTASLAAPNPAPRPLTRRPTKPSPFQSLANLLAASDGTGWDAYGRVAGVRWRHSGPVECLDVDSTPQWRFVREGTGLLAGLGPALLPTWDEAEGAGARTANEGECSIALYGDAETVHEAVLVKYHPTDDVVGVLRRQLSTDAALESQADAVDEIHIIRFRDGGVAYVAVEHVEGGRSGPGFTAFVVTREHPRPRDAR